MSDEKKPRSRGSYLKDSVITTTANFAVGLPVVNTPAYIKAQEAKAAEKEALKTQHTNPLEPATPASQKWSSLEAVVYFVVGAFAFAAIPLLTPEATGFVAYGVCVAMWGIFCYAATKIGTDRDRPTIETKEN